MDCKAFGWAQLFLIVVTLMAVAACHSGPPKPPKPPEYRLDVTIVDIQPGEIHVLEQTYELTLRVQNPHNFDIESNGMRFTLETNGNTFARGVSNQLATIPRLGEAVVKVRAVSDVSRAAAQINELRSMMVRGFRYRIYGRIFAPDSSYPFDYRGQFVVNPAN